MIFVIHRGLLRNQFSLLLRQLCDIELIAKCSSQCHMASRCEWSHTADGVVRAYADVCTHCAERVNEGGSLLDFQTLDRIGVIGAPDLRAVVEHSRVKTRTAAGAVLQKQIRELLHQTLLHRVHAEHVAVEQLLLGILIEIGAAEIA